MYIYNDHWGPRKCRARENLNTKGVVSEREREMAYNMMKKNQQYDGVQVATCSMGVMMVIMVVSMVLLGDIEHVHALCGPYVRNTCEYGGNSSACDAYCKSCHPRFRVCGDRTDCTSCTNCTSGYCIGILCSCNYPCTSCSNTDLTSPSPSPSITPTPASSPMSTSSSSPTPSPA